ncbi:BTB domain-containing protein [Caenorhabditis elegans]|uniref:BTB domain-containing protein n=1 Tax=Caenorhabditis elegans TaxID=6239 RepID=O16741_CAEEL|nr:BTB domain-containing protein [Caenorhabditis elegans]CCD71256.1 BTB domain-containing protein [Caenorhabditis elegans]|eukprot:NP_494054.1 BTB (Broad/complex/Tramtrack/Bric a brac) domain protein [Caenorhabditis elegans]
MDKTKNETLEFASDWMYATLPITFYSDCNGLKCNVSIFNPDDQFLSTVKFDWDQKVIKDLTGTFTWIFDNSGGSCNQQLESITLDKPGQCYAQKINWNVFDYNYLRCKYSLTPNCCQEKCSDNKVALTPKKSPGQKVPEHKPTDHEIGSDVSYEKLFAPSNRHDAVLLIGEKKLHVSKAFLSYHSDYFSDLFADKINEEIRLEDVSYEDFGLLMSIIHPETGFVNDQNAEKLLHLGNRFKISCVIHQVEHHFTRGTNFSNERLIFLADKYELQKLLEKAIQEMNSLDKAKKFGGSDDYKKLSDFARGKISDRLMQLLIN